MDILKDLSERIKDVENCPPTDISTKLTEYVDCLDNMDAKIVNTIEWKQMQGDVRSRTTSTLEMAVSTAIVAWCKPGPESFSTLDTSELCKIGHAVSP